MDGKTYLNQLRDIMRSIDRLVEKYELLSHRAIGIGSPALKEDCIQTSHSQDMMSSSSCDLVDLENEINRLKDTYRRIGRNIWEDLKGVDNDRYRRILYKRYFESKSISQIAEEEGIQERSVKRAHKRALEEYEKIFSENSENSEN